jgi:hypothetical protein
MCGEWSMRSLWELDISTAMSAGWDGHSPSCRRGQGQNAAQLLFLRCLHPESSNRRSPCSWQLQCHATPRTVALLPGFLLYTINSLEVVEAVVCLHQSTQATWPQLFCMFVFCLFSITSSSQLGSKDKLAQVVRGGTLTGTN